jgi:hypothetical protein
VSLCSPREVFVGTRGWRLPVRFLWQGHQLWVSRSSCPLSLLFLLVAVKNVAAENLLRVLDYLLL